MQPQQKHPRIPQVPAVGVKLPIFHPCGIYLQNRLEQPCFFLGIAIKKMGIGGCDLECICAQYMYIYIYIFILYVDIVTISFMLLGNLSEIRPVHVETGIMGHR